MVRPKNKRGEARLERLRIERLSLGGSGVAKRADGAVVLVAGAAPGDLVEAEVAPGRPPRGHVVRVLEPGPNRVEPACPHVAACGGCDWMHLGLDAQAAAHAELVRSAVAHALSIPEGAVPAIAVHRAPAGLGYRTRARVFVKAERGVVRVGYRAAGTHALAAVSECLVLHPSIAPLLGELPAILRGARGEGDVHLACGAGERPTIDVSWRGELAPETFRELDERVARRDLAGARVRYAGTARPASFGDARPRMQGADGEPLVLAAGGFAQPSDEGAALLARRVAELALGPRAYADSGPGAARPAAGAPERRPRVLELFAGSGTLSVLLARGAESLTAVEVDAEAAACLRENLDRRGLAAKVVVADAEAFAIPPRTDLVVLDPPRTGARGAARAVAASKAKAVVYVSCDPATLARDLAELAATGLVLTDLETVELFPQTSHVEAVARLARPRRAEEA